VKDYLVNHGIGAERISGKGVMPAVDKNNILNRMVEIKIIRK
jgi:hypothetical protein